MKTNQLRAALPSGTFASRLARCGACAAVLLAGVASRADELRAPVTRDTWFSDVGKEADGNLGAAPQMKLKSIQEMSLVDLDPTPLKGHAVRRAEIHLKKRGSEVLRRVTVSSFNADWVEGTASNYEPQEGSSCFNWQKYPDVSWAFPGSDLTAVTLGQGGSVWGSADASAPDAQGWMTISIEPRVMAARVAGVSRGFLLFDDTGSEWTHQGEAFKLRPFPNRFVFSQDNGKVNAPYFTIELGAADRLPPQPPEEFKFDTTGLEAGEAEVSWLTPADRGPAGVAGFVVTADDKPVPQYLVPAPGKTGERVTMHLRDLGFGPGQIVSIVVRAVDGAGNVGDPATCSVHTSAQLVRPLPGSDPQPFAGEAPLPQLGRAEVAVLDALDKVMPTTGRMVPPQDPAYLAANHLWSAREKRIRLAGARNEFVSFQLLIKGTVKDVSAELEFPGTGAKPAVRFYRYADAGSNSGPVPDPLVPLSGPYSTPAGDQSGSLLCEIYLPHDLPAGAYRGTLTLKSAGQSLRLAVDLTARNFSLPDKLSFIPEMNCYGLPENERDYYRLAHVNRVALNRVPYHQNGEMSPGCAPKWDGRTLDWSAWDQRFGPYFDGSAFADLPRGKTPLEIFYLPLFENWPTPMRGNYNDSYWADRAFPPAYRAAFVECSREFAEHFNRKHWDQTLFHCFFNGKNNFKQNGWSRGSCPWLLDEPANFQDYWALRWFGQAFHDGADPAKGAANLMFRCDISRPEWQRDALDGVLNYNVVAGGAFHRYHRLVMDRKRSQNQMVLTYGSSNNPADSNMQPVGWCWESWTLGADGVLPWQVIGTDASWKKAEDTCLFYPGGAAGQKEPVPSVRLKAYLRGEQDVEYLVLLQKKLKQPRLVFGQSVRQALPLGGQRKGTGFAGEDAGVIVFSDLKPQDVWRIRQRIGQVLSE